MEIYILLISILVAFETSIILYVSLVKRGASRSKAKPMFIDTSSLIDGRLLALAESGFLSNDLIYIPQSVIAELHTLADGSSSEKRAKARLGLDIVSELQSTTGLNVMIYKDDIDVPEGVDQRLLTLAKKESGIICTVDYNLNKVAITYGIGVANINNLAKSLRLQYLPGDAFRVHLSSKGSDPFQAVGHLDDGTMVVVDQAQSDIGTTQDVICTRSIQTAAGRMVFARLDSQPIPNKINHKRTRPVRRSDNQ